MSALPPTLASNANRAQYDLAFQTSPIILSGGIAATAQGGLLPISSLTPSASAEPFARYLPLEGSTLISQSVGMYPFANQSVAANATIQQPLTISMGMIAPVNQPGGYLAKLHVFSALQNALAQHNAAGGMYIIATPAFVYNNLLMTAMTDISQGDETHQYQINWQLDFIQPLVTLQGATAALSTLLQKVSGGTKFTGTPAWSGNTAASPASATGVTASLNTALSTFGATVTNTP